eukprot:TRINITY_DN52328_c0_g1_i1.p1 TRINITY_DN52328_c0_g1~~TRINITY_DN52328_c0_g1_i1.p1  ORF type:complete len:202 (+),score=18.45 TRINITY_DN52328_c0_g1_i1:88-606(+)
MAAKLVLQRFPPQVVALQALQLHIMADVITATADVRLLNAAELSVIIQSALTTEGSLKLKEEYTDGEVTTPVLPPGTLPAPLQGVYDQMTSSVKALPASLQDTIAAGLKVPLGKRYSRELLVSYLDEELLVVRDDNGMVDVLVRSDTTTSINRNEEEGGVDPFTEDPTDYIS